MTETIKPTGEQSFVIEYEGAIYFTHGAWKFDLHPAQTDPMLRETVDQLKRFLADAKHAKVRLAAITEIAFIGQSTGPGLGPHAVIRRHPQDGQSD